MVETPSKPNKLGLFFTYTKNTLFTEFSGRLSPQMLFLLIEKHDKLNEFYQPKSICVNFSDAIFNTNLSFNPEITNELHFSCIKQLKMIIMICPEEIFSRIYFNRLCSQVKSQLKNKINTLKCISDYHSARDWLKNEKQLISSEQLIASDIQKTSLI